MISSDLPHMVGMVGFITIEMPTSDMMGVVKCMASSRHLRWASTISRPFRGRMRVVGLILRPTA